MEITYKEKERLQRRSGESRMYSSRVTFTLRDGSSKNTYILLKQQQQQSNNNNIKCSFKAHPHPTSSLHIDSESCKKRMKKGERKERETTFPIHFPWGTHSLHPQLIVIAKAAFFHLTWLYIYIPGCCTFVEREYCVHSSSREIITGKTSHHSSSNKGVRVSM